MEKLHQQPDGLHLANQAWVLFAAAGVIASMIGWFAPIHEFGHILAALLQGGGGRFDGWRHAQLWGVWDNLVWFVNIGGFAFEQAVFYGITVYAIRKRHYYLAALTGAHFTLTTAVAPIISSDFDTLGIAWLVAFWAVCAFAIVRMGVKLAYMLRLEAQTKKAYREQLKQQLSHAT